jgi:hypothetical protein
MISHEQGRDINFIKNIHCFQVITGMVSYEIILVQFYNS